MTDLKKLVLFALGCAIMMLMASCCFAEETVKDQVKCYTTWDEIYLYLSFKVDCPDIRGTHNKPNAEISGDDCVSVYLQNSSKRTDKITPTCFSMTVSSAGGAQFCAGTDSDGFKQQTVYNYKYGSTVQGTINNSDDIDMGYTVEMAIPWDLLKLDSPQTGDMFGFNIIVRRHDTKAGEFVSLSPKVTSEEDVLNPSKWSSLVIAANSFGAATLSSEKVLSAKYIVRAPTINGVISDKEWNNNTSFAMDMPLPKGFVYEAKFPVQKTVMAPFYYDYQGDWRKPGYSFLDPTRSDSPEVGRKLTLADFPAKNVGPWFSNDRVQWYKEEFSDMAAAGVDVVLPVVSENADNAIDVMVSALDELKKEAKPYPMVGLYCDPELLPFKLDSSINEASYEQIYSAIKNIYNRIPEEYRAFIQAKNGQVGCALVISRKFGTEDAGAGKYASLEQYCAEHFTKDFNAPLIVVQQGVNDNKISLACVSPVENSTRLSGAPYEQSWTTALESNPNWIICDSWNDFKNGTDICASRQYGRKFIDITRENAKKFKESGELATRYLACSMPKIIPSKQFAQAELTIRNVGMQVWKASDGIALGYRWYKNGRFYGESKVKRPLGRDVNPGENITLNIGIATVNAAGTPIPDGNAEVRFELFRTIDGKWFSALGDQPLMVPVTIGQAPEWGASYLECSAPVMVAGGQSYPSVIRARNDGSQPWLKGSMKLVCKLYRVPSKVGEQEQEVAIKEIKSILVKDCKPGEIAEFAFDLNLLQADKKPLPVSDSGGAWSYQLRFDINNGEKLLSELGTPALNKMIDVFESDYGARIADSDLPSKLQAGQSVEAKVVVRNNGVSMWDRKRVKIGYHWYYLDGTELEWDGLTTPIMTNLQPGWPTVVKAKVKVPEYDGQYVLVWDVMVDGKWLSTGPISRGGDILPMTVEVTGGKLAFVELGSIYDTAATSSDADRTAGNFDGKGNSFPSELMIPDAGLTQEACWIYPAGYQCVPENMTSGRISFYYPDKNPGIKNAVSCSAQSVNVEQGRYGVLHILGASTSGNASGEITLNYGGSAKPAKFDMSDWGARPAYGEAIAFSVNYRHSANGDSADACRLYDYAIPVDPTQDLTAITLPNNPDMKIMAMTLERASFAAPVAAAVEEKK